MISLYTSRDFVRPGDFRSKQLKKKAPVREAHTYQTSSEYGRIVHSMAFRRLQGKMQLFPATESPLLRNRLTHTLEVADIAANIAKKINDSHGQRELMIDASIVGTAALAHDLGHPPFGHSGEMALNEFMSGFGGFEGNAQSLRIITRLENRFVEEFPRTLSHVEVYRDPLGLNLLLRTIAAVIKYDDMILLNDSSPEPKKGYYQEDWRIVDLVKSHVIKTPNYKNVKLRTIESQIMDIADDIAYSTYDLEDCLIAGIINPVDLMALDDRSAAAICAAVNKKFKHYGYQHCIEQKEVISVFFKLFDDIIGPSVQSNYNWHSMTHRTTYVAMTYREAKSFGINPLFRRRLTEVLIQNAVGGITLEKWNEQEPALTRIDMLTRCRLFIEVLKAYNYHMVIRSSRLQVYQQRSFEIINKLCTILYKNTDDVMLPPVVKEGLDFYMRQADEYFDISTGRFKVEELKNRVGTERRRKRAICDFVSALTDSEAMSLFAKLTSSDQRTVFGI